MQTQTFETGLPAAATKNMEVFTAERLDTDICLVSSVREMLVASGLLPNVIVYFDTNNYIQEAYKMRPEGQRFLLNRFWNLQLLVIDVNTVDERFCLISNGECIDWLRLFKQKILPCAILHRLPTQLV